MKFGNGATLGSFHGLFRIVLGTTREAGLPFVSGGSVASGAGRTITNCLSVLRVAAHGGSFQDVGGLPSFHVSRGSLLSYQDGRPYRNEFCVVGYVVSGAVRPSVRAIFFYRHPHVHVETCIRSSGWYVKDQYRRSVEFDGPTSSKISSDCPSLVALGARRELSRHFRESLSVHFGGSVRLFRFTFFGFFGSVVGDCLLCASLLFLFDPKDIGFHGISYATYVRGVRVFTYFQGTIRTRGFCEDKQFDTFRFASNLVDRNACASPAFTYWGTIARVRHAVLCGGTRSQPSIFVRLNFGSSAMDLAVQVHFRLLRFDCRRCIFGRFVRSFFFLYKGEGRGSVPAPFFAGGSFVKGLFLGAFEVYTKFVGLVGNCRGQRPYVLHVVSYFRNLQRGTIIDHCSRSDSVHRLYTTKTRYYGYLVSQDVGGYGLVVFVASLMNASALYSATNFVRDRVHETRHIGRDYFTVVGISRGDGCYQAQFWGSFVVYFQCVFNRLYQDFHFGSLYTRFFHGSFCHFVVRVLIGYCRGAEGRGMFGGFEGFAPWFFHRFFGDGTFQRFGFYQVCDYFLFYRIFFLFILIREPHRGKTTFFFSSTPFVILLYFLLVEAVPSYL